MPLHGKIVVIKRSGIDGTEFPLTASCLFGRKPDCDIRIQLPQVSKEHCRIELNENKEIILTNLSSVNPTRINGEVLQQSERLKHGDLITIIDRSFRFEYPPEPTPKKKRPSTTGKSETLQVLHDQQVREASAVVSAERRKSELSSDTCLKDGSNTGHLQSSMEQTVEAAPKEDGSLEQSKPISPFCELYQMIKQDLDAKSPWKPYGGQAKTPLSSRASQKPVAAKDAEREVQESAGGVESTPKKEAPVACAEEGAEAPTTPKSAKKKRRSTAVEVQVQVEERSAPAALEGGAVSAPREEKPVGAAAQRVASATPEKTPEKKRRSAQPKTPTAPERSTATTPVSQKKTPQKYSAGEVAQQILSAPQSAEKTPKSPKSPKRRSGVTPLRPAATPKTPEAPVPEQAEGSVEEVQAEGPMKQSPRNSPRANAGKRFQVQDVLREIKSATPSTEENAAAPSSKKKRKSGSLDADLPTPMPKRKRVSFGGQLSPELFDKRMPPDSPLRRGATPGRHSLSLAKMPLSLLRRASTIGLMQGMMLEEPVPQSPKAKGSKTAKTPSPAKTPKTAKTPSPAKTPKTAKTPSPAKTPKTAKTPSPAKTPKNAKTPSPAKTPKTAKTPSPAKIPKTAKTPSPAKTPKTAKTPSPAKTPKTAKTPSPAKTPKTAKTPSPAKTPKTAKTPSPAKTPKTAKTPSPAKTPKTEKTPSLAKKSPAVKSKTPSPTKTLARCQSASKEELQTPKGQKSPKSAKTTPAAGPGSLIQTATVQGRFSITRISTPSPISDHEGGAKENPVPVSEMPLECTTPMVPLRRKSMKASVKKSAMKSAHEVIRSRRSGASLANLKVVNSWADIVKFGEIKPQTAVAPKKTTTRGKTAKKTVVPKPKTPVRKLKDHVSTGHAASPVTIVVGKAHMRTQPFGGVPKLVPNIALLKRDMKMDEDFTGVSDIFKTPANSKQRKAVASDNSCLETPLGVPSTSMVEMSLMNTPEETDEMMVSPLSVASTAKCGRYNSEAVTRLLQGDQEASFITAIAGEAEDSLSVPEDVPVLEVTDYQPAEELETVVFETAEELETVVSETAEEPETIVSETAEEPETVVVSETAEEPETVVVSETAEEPETVVVSETAEEPETVVSETAEEPETVVVSETAEEPETVVVSETAEEPETVVSETAEEPETVVVSETTEEQETAVSETTEEPDTVVSKTTEEQETAVSETTIRTPKQKPEPASCLTGVKRLLRTPKQQAEPVDDLCGKLIKTPREPKAPQEETLVGVKELLKTPKHRGEPVEDMAGVKRVMQTPKVKSKPVEAKLGLKRLMQTPKQKREPVEEDLTGVQHLMKTPKQKGEPVKDQFGISKLMKTPRLKGGKAVEDFAGLKELVVPASDSSPEVEETKPNEAEETMSNTVPELEETKPTEVVEVEETKPTEVESVEVEDTKISEAVMSVEMQEAVTTSECPSDSLVTEEVQNACDEDKENVCPVEEVHAKDVISADTECVAETASANHSAPDTEPMEELSSNSPVKETMEEPGKNTEEETVSPVEEVQAEEETSVTQCASETVSAVQCMPEAELDTEAEKKQSSSLPAKKATRGRRAKTEQEPEKTTEENIEMPSTAQSEGSDEQKTEDLISVASVAQTPVPVKCRRGKKLVEMPEASPARQSARGRIPKRNFGDEEKTKSVAGPPALLDPVDVQEEISTCPTPVVKPRRGGKAKPDSLEQVIEPVSEVSASAELEAVEPPIEVIESQEQKAPALKPRRGRKAKQEVPFAQDTEISSVETVSEDKPVDSESIELLSSAETEATATAVLRPKRGRRAKQETTEISMSVEEPNADIEPVEENAVSVMETEVPQTPVVKSGRGRKAKQIVTEVVEKNEPKVDIEPVVEYVVSSVETEVKPQTSVAKSGRGRKIKQPKAQVSVEVEEKVDAQPVVEDRVPVTETEEQPEPTVLKTGRGRKTKQGKIQVSAQVEEKVKVKPAVEDAISTAEPEEQPEAPVVKSGRGRKAVAISAPVEEPKADIEPVEENAVSVMETEVPQTPVVKSGRGRKAKQIVTKVVEKNKPKVDIEPVVEDVVSSVETEVKPQTSVAKSGRGRKTKQPKAQVSVEVEEKVDAQPVVEDRVPVTETEEQPEPTVVKTGRGRKTKQGKAQVSAQVEEKVQVESEVEDTTSSAEQEEQLKAPVVKSGRGRKVVAAKKDEDVLVVPAKRGRHGAIETTKQAATATAPSTKPGRGRKAAVKAEQEIAAEDATPTEQPSESESSSFSTSEEATVEVPVKKGKGRAPRKGKVVAKESSVDQAEEPETVEEQKASSKKMVNWNPDLVTSKVLEESEHLVVEEEPQQKKLRRRGAPATEAASEEPEQASEPQPKACRGRGAKKPSEPPAEEPVADTPQNPEPVAETKAQSARRGRAAASKVNKPEPTNEVAPPTPKRGGKRKEVAEEVADDAPATESPPKKRRGKAAKVEEALAEAAAPSKGKKGPGKKAEKALEVEEKSEPTPKKEAPKAVRGKRKVAQDADPTQSPEGPISGENANTNHAEPTSRGRDRKKVEAVIPAEAAPAVRRTRRK